MADVPNVAADIDPIHSLVSKVMDGVGEPKLVIQSGASPHGYRLRPSEAKALQDANLIFWMGEELTPWLDGAIDTLASNATVTSLLDQEGVLLHDFREGALFEAHDHSAHDDHDDHGHGAHDPHAWLSPENAKLWLNIIASKLSVADPENAASYFTNAAAGQAEIEDMVAEVSATLKPVQGGKFVVFHDAYQYFENDFDFYASGAISLGDASDPSPARIAEIQRRIQEEGIQCVLAEPQYKKGLVATVMEGSNATASVIDPLGADIKPGPKLYTQLIKNMAKTLRDCL